MKEEAREMRVLRSVGAIFAGLLTIFVTHNGIDAVLHATGVFPPLGEPMADGLFVLALAYRIVFSVVGCYVTARLAAHHPMGHALTLSGIGVVLSSLGALATIGQGPEFGPIWYPLALVAVSLPSGWAGGALRLRELRGRTTPEVAPAVA